MREVDKAYVAGFLDGDGSIMACIEPHKEMRFGHRVRVVVKFSQIREGEPLLKDLQRIIGSGYLTRSGNAVEYVIKEKEALRQFLKDIQPYVRNKRPQVEKALALLSEPKPTQESDLLRQAQFADAIADANIKSRSRRRNTSMTLLSHSLPL